jgi:cytochrome c oxidase subunit 3
MKSSNQKIGSRARRPVLERIEHMHPLKMINYLLISVSCIIFAVICFFFVNHLAVELGGSFHFEIPKFFVVSALILVISTHFTFKLVGAFERDAISELRKLVSFSMIAGLSFFLSQSLAWMEILKLDLEYQQPEIASYLFVFSGVHFLHALAGVVMSAMLFYKYMLIETDPVKTLIVTTNPNEKVKLEIFFRYWGFVVFSWGLIFLMLLFVF